MGTSWYVIYRGSVNVVVNGVVVCALQEGEGFGELALVNDRPRSVLSLHICDSYLSLTDGGGGLSARPPL